MKVITLFVWVLGLMLILSCSAMTATIHSSGTLGSLIPATQNGNPTTGTFQTDGDDQLVPGLVKFDSTLGTLNKVTIQITNATIGGQYRAENLGHKTGGIDFSMSVDAAIKTTFGSSSLLEVDLSNSSSTYHLGTFDNNIDWAGTSGMTVDAPRATGTGGPSVLTSGFSDFEAVGGGVLNVNVDAATVTHQSATANFISYFQTYAAVTADVTYDYTAKTSLPEPSNFMMLSAGLLSLTGLAWRKRR